MADYISFQPKDVFKAKDYTGNGSTQSITGVGFQPGLNWIKDNSTDRHNLTDAARGATYWIRSDQTAASTADANAMTAFNADGFSVGTTDAVNKNTIALTSWNWKTGTSTGVSGGTITPSAYSINTTSKFGIYKYTGNATSGATIAHGLGVAPKLLITKKISTTGDWHVAHPGNTYPWNSYLYLNSADAAQEVNSATWFLNDTAPDATNITLGNGAGINGSGVDYIIYAWAPVKGYSAFGVYEGNGNADGTFVYTGFQPEFIIAKNRDSGGPAAYGWSMITNTYGMSGATTANPSYNELTQNFFADQAVARTTGNAVDFLSNGFKWRSTGNAGNQSSSPFVYMAWAKQPLVSSNSKAGTAR